MWDPLGSCQRQIGKILYVNTYSVLCIHNKAQHHTMAELAAVGNFQRWSSVENRLMVDKEEGVGRGMEWEVGVSRCKFLYIEWMSDKVLVYNTGNYMLSCDNGKEYRKEGGFPDGTSGKETVCQCRRWKRHGFDPCVRKIPWRRVWQSTPLFLPGESHELRSLVGYNPWGRKESDMTEVI